jgi:hypothetical protein
VTNDPNMNPKPERPAIRFGCGCNKAVSAQVAAKIVQITALNLTIVVRVLFALVVFLSVFSCSIRISPLHFPFEVGKVVRVKSSSVTKSGT